MCPSEPNYSYFLSSSTVSTILFLATTPCEKALFVISYRNSGFCCRKFLLTLKNKWGFTFSPDSAREVSLSFLKLLMSGPITKKSSIKVSPDECLFSLLDLLALWLGARKLSREKWTCSGIYSSRLCCVGLNIWFFKSFEDAGNMAEVLIDLNRVWLERVEL